MSALPFLAFGLALAIGIPRSILVDNPSKDVAALRWSGWGIVAVALTLGSLRGAVTIDVGGGHVEDRRRKSPMPPVTIPQ